MKKLIEMPEVLKCDAKGCAYNLDLVCHARGITIGDVEKRHLCDTQWSMKGHTHRKEGAGVGACRASNCAHNDDLECQADGVNISMTGSNAQCATFSAR